MIKADLHMHTTFSDGISTPEEVVEEAIKKGLGCVCITDHDTLKGAVKAMKFAYDKDILVVPGIEVITKSGDMLGINVKKIIPSGLSSEETIKEIRKQGGIAVVPHPFNRPLNAFWGGEKMLKQILPDAIEAFNATIFFNRSNTKALNFSKHNNLSFTAGSDAHRKEFVGRGYIETSKNIATEKDLVNVILSRQAIAGGKPLSFWELLKSGEGSDIKDMIRYILLKRKNRRRQKYE